jgi:hypothetical protein
MIGILVHTKVIDAKLDDLGIEQESEEIKTFMRLDHISLVREAYSKDQGKSVITMISGDEYLCTESYDIIMEMIKNPKTI